MDFNTLHAAIFSGWADGADVSQVQRLIDAGHDVDGHDDAGNTPLLSAALSAAMAERSEAATRLLLDNGADPNRFDVTKSRGPLHVAVCGIGTATVRRLLEGGADPNRLDHHGAAPVHHALEELRRARGRGIFDDDTTAAGTAAAFVTEHLAALSDHGADFNLSTTSGMKPLQLAALIQSCPDSVIDALLDGGAVAGRLTVECEGADVDLLSSCLFSDLSAHVASRFVDAGCPWDAPYLPFDGRTFLEVVPQFRPEVALALGRHSDAFRQDLLRFRNEDGINSLAIAAASGFEPLLCWLAEHGLLPTEQAADGTTALDIARKHQPQTVALLERLATEAEESSSLK